MALKHLKHFFYIIIFILKKDFQRISGILQHMHHLPGEDALNTSGRHPPGLAMPSGDDAIPEWSQWERPEEQII